MINIKNIFRISGVILFVLSIFLIHLCKKDKPTSPIITTIAISAITQAIATAGGNVTRDGGAPVSSRGICWGLSSDPTIADNKTTNGAVIGNFASAITGLVVGTTSKLNFRNYEKVFYFPYPNFYELSG